MVKVNYFEDKPYILAALGVRISQSPLEKTVEELYDECKINETKSKELVNNIMRKYGHLILADFLPYAITLEDISRFAAIYFWRNVNSQNLVFGAGIEASFRVIRPDRFNDIVGEIGKKAMEFYKNALELGVLEQDARYILPEGTLTRMIFSAPPRYLMKLANTLKRAPLLELQEIGQKIALLIEKNFSLEIPEETLPSQWSFWGEKDIEEGISLDYKDSAQSLSLNMGIKGSLSMYAQLVRQRQLLCEIEPLEGIAKRGIFVVPPTFPEKVIKYYQEIAHEAVLRQTELVEKRDPNFVYFLLLGQEARAMVYGKGYGIIETSKARSEGVAQWEIRNKVGIPLTRELAKYDELRNEIGPRCWREKRCIEPRTFREVKNICKVFKITQGKWNKSLEELLEMLRESYRTFRIQR